MTEGQDDLLRALLKAAGIEFETDTPDAPKETAPATSLPGFLEKEVDTTDCQGCWFKGLVPLGECPFPRCAAYHRPDSKNVIFLRGG